MYSGSDSADSQKFKQWPINPAAYQNTPNDQVDWAALAQQWIIMKEAGPPPIPGEQPVILNKESKSSKSYIDECGEAPMEVETDKDEASSWSSSALDNAPPPPGTEAWSNWNPPSNWNWSNSWNVPSGVPPPIGIPPVKTPLLPTPESFSSPPDNANDNAVSFKGYTTAPPPNNFTPGFWTGMGGGKITQTEIKPHNKRYSKVNVPTKVTIITPPASTPAVAPAPDIMAVPDPVPVPVPTPTLDANKRKQLPAWIREGLEKMERDKQKQLEKEREKYEREEYKEKIKQEEKEKMEILKTTMHEREMRKSRFDSDDNNSDEDIPRTKKFSPPPITPMTPEQLMIKVRKIMTEILLKATNQHIEQICKEEIQRYLKKTRASDHLASAPSGAVLSAKLGLGVYDDGSDSDSGEDHTDGANRDSQRNDQNDSDLELKETIRRKQAEFAKTEREIEARLTEAEQKKGRSRSESESSESRDGNSSPAQLHVDGNSQKLAPEETKHQTKRHSSVSSSASSNYLETKTKMSRRRSTSSSRSDSRRRSDSPERDRRRRDAKRRSRSSESGRKTKRSRRSRSDSRYSRRSRKSRSPSKSSYSSRRSVKSSRRSRSRSTSRERRRGRSKRSESRSRTSSRRQRWSRSSSRRRSRSRSRRKERSRSRRRRSSRSSSRGKRSHRR
ncbi:arginine/serine-rich protein PNISR [Sitophilus oryzae]|uniref:Arginine/serine-rich protein PNISR n=1 Tax=Sitophilus oryzae TaxID=7048 RepID=A0A6J2YRS4_SITOR|nr:arginine/serine-rich protein PNISR [Sitophilus oryzae]